MASLTLIRDEPLKELKYGRWGGGGEEKLNVTISLGATLFKEGDTVDTLIERTDRLLYQSKNAGRNRPTRG